MSKNLPIAYLETIYEESASSIHSRSNSQCDSNYQLVNGLISARSIPSVDVERQRIYENKKKPPIEVQCRDGSKHFIHQSITSTMIMNKKQTLNSFDKNFSSNKSIPVKRPIVVTIITAEDLQDATITPTFPLATSDSDLSIRSNSQATSPFVQVKSFEDISEALLKPSNIAPVQSPIADTTIQQLSLSTMPITNLHSDSQSLFDILLPDNENEKTFVPDSSQLNPVESQLSPSTITRTNVSNGVHSFFKRIPIKIQPIPIRPRVSSTLASKPNQSVQQKNCFYSTYYQPNIAFTSYQIPTNPSAYPYNSLIPTDKGVQLPSNRRSLYQQNSSNYQPSPPLPASLQYINYLLPINQQYSNYPWCTVTSNPPYDVSHRSKQYSNIS